MSNFTDEASFEIAVSLTLGGEVVDIPCSTWDGKFRDGTWIAVSALSGAYGDDLSDDDGFFDKAYSGVLTPGEVDDIERREESASLERSLQQAE
jgi:hypothetical protein